MILQENGNSYIWIFVGMVISFSILSAVLAVVDALREIAKAIRERNRSL